MIYIMAMGKKPRSSNVSQTYLFSLTQPLLRKTFLALSYNGFYSIGILWNHWCIALYKNRRKKSIFFMYFQSFHIISYFAKLWLLLYFTKLWFYRVLCSNAFHFLHKGLWEYWYTRSISFYVHSHSYGPLCVMCARIFLYKMHIIHISDIVYWVF